MREITNIWLIDDDYFSLNYGQQIVNQCDSSKVVTSFSNAYKALNLLKKTKGTEYYPDLILLDLYMPIMSGFQFIEELEGLKNHVLPQIIIVSDIIDNSEQLKLRKSALVNAYVSKPIKKKMLEDLFRFNKQVASFDKGRNFGIEQLG